MFARTVHDAGVALVRTERWNCNLTLLLQHEYKRQIWKPVPVNGPSRRKRALHGGQEQPNKSTSQLTSWNLLEIRTHVWRWS